MEVVVIYEIDKEEFNSDVNAGMKDKSYYKSWKYKEKSYKLPDNCFWKPDGTLAEGKQDMIDVVAQISRSKNTPVKLTKCLVLPSIQWEGIPTS
ncbi:MAG: hypothetical protein ABI367_07965 [Mucilaginibacter sp.]